MPPRTYRITTLGCRVNHAESRDLETTLRNRGLAPAGGADPPDLLVVHSCSVTTAAAAKSRHAARRAARQAGPRPDRPPHVIVTGCYAGTNPEEAAGVADRIVPHEAEDGRVMVDRFAAAVDAWLAGTDTDTVADAPADTSAPPTTHPLPVVPPAVGAGAHVRAEVRIQDGCDAHCTFCIIPKIRRTLRSKTIDDAVAETRRLVDLGHLEIVLSGIFIGAYGHETALRRRQRRPGAEPLADLLDAVAQVPGLERVRISSMEPGDVTGSLLDAMVAHAGVVVPHLHLPLQSGSDAVLRRMNRQYGTGDYLEMIDEVNAALTVDGLPPAITTDVICGFPGETDEDFAATVAVAARVGYLHMHVFPYSPRPGTAAARWRDRFVPHAVVKARVRRLIDLEEDPETGLSIRFRRRLVGRRVRVLLEQRSREDPACMTGRCDHYALLTVPTRRPRGTMLEVTVDAVAAGTTRATPAARIGLPILI